MNPKEPLKKTQNNFLALTLMVVGSLLVCYLISILAHTIVNIADMIATIVGVLAVVSIAWIIATLVGSICLPISQAISQKIKGKTPKMDNKNLQPPIYEFPPAFFSQPALQTSCYKQHFSSYEPEAPFWAEEIEKSSKRKKRKYKKRKH